MWSRPYPERATLRRRAAAPVVLGICTCWLILFLGFAVSGGLTTAAGRTNATIQAPARAIVGWLQGDPDAIDYDAVARELGVPQLKLMVAPQHLARLTRQRRQAIEDRVLIAGDGDFVPGLLESESKLHKIKLRLKGDNVDHLTSEQWSLRIKVRDGFVHGMRTLSLQGSNTRGGHGELMLLKMMRKAGVLAPRAFFVRVVLNDRDLGLMVLEEHFNKELLESQGRREGVILAFDEDLVWRQRRGSNRRARRGRPVADAKKLPLDVVPWMPLRVFGAGAVWEDAVLRDQHRVATGLMRGFLAGDLTAEDVFDMRLLARHHVICSLWGATHGYVAHNLRFYFNPITRLFEVIAFDNNTGPGGLRRPAEFVAAEFPAGVTSDVFWSECRRFLSELEAELQGDRLLQLLQLDEHYRRCVEAGGRRLLQRYGVAGLPARFARLRSGLQARGTPVEREVAAPPRIAPEDGALVHAQAAWVRDHAGCSLELGSVTTSPVVVEGAVWCKGERRIPLALPRTVLRGIADRLRHPVDVDPVRDGGRIEVRTRLVAGGDARRHDAHRSYPALAQPPLRTATLSALLARHPFLRRAAGGVRVVGGRHELAESLVLPRGARLVIDAGAELVMAEAGRVVVQGDLEVEGRAAAPVTLRGGALVVLGSGGSVHLTCLRPMDMSGLRERDWALTGGVTVHDCRVRAVDCRFAANRCEDALNLIHCTFEVERCVFADTPSDALDVDFGSGRVVDCHFQRIGGDAVDLSGARVELADLRFAEVRDKALSVGERAHCRARGLIVRNVGVAVASKDASVVYVEDVQATGVTVATLMVYVKKPAFGPARLIAERVTAVEPPARFLAQTGCELQVDGVPVPGSALDVEGLYHAGPMKKHP